jgi:hypothetical protein
MQELRQIYEVMGFVGGEDLRCGLQTYETVWVLCASVLVKSVLEI